MTGMKEGAGEDPFAEPSEPSEPEPTDKPEQNESHSTTAAVTDSTDTQPTDQNRSIQIPYKFRRDGVKTGRDRVPLFLQAETKSDERDALRELEERFDDDVSLTDLREALVKVGLQHLDDVEDHLEEWGYGMTFDE